MPSRKRIANAIQESVEKYRADVLKVQQAAKSPGGMATVWHLTEDVEKAGEAALQRVWDELLNTPKMLPPRT